MGVTSIQMIFQAVRSPGEWIWREREEDQAWALDPANVKRLEKRGGTDKGD